MITFIKASGTYFVSRKHNLDNLMICLCSLVTFSNARKLFRMFKSLIEWQKINLLLGKANSTPPLKFILQLIPRVSFFFFWILDTIVVLSKIKFLTTVDNVKLMYRWAVLWTIANVTSLLGALLELFDLAQEE